MTLLPEYGRPPVVEVAIGVQFAPLAGLSVGHVGLYWATIYDSFPRVEEQTPIIHVVEPPHGPPETVIAFQLTDKPGLPRTWFLDASGNRVIQVQRDRFLHNWRKVKPSDEYPRFPSVRDSFLRRWADFQKFLAFHKLEPQLDQCELTYVNHIKNGEGWRTITDLEKLFTTFSWQTRSSFLPNPDNVRWTLRFPLPENNGRLHVEVVPARVPPENDLVLRFSLTARGRPSGPVDSEAMAKWFSLAREWIVRGFSDLVDKETDALWEKKS